MEKRLNGGIEIKGVLFSGDKRVRFAPKEKYRLGNHTFRTLADDGFIIASCDVEGAEKLAKASSKFKDGFDTYGEKEITKGEIRQRVSWIGRWYDSLSFSGNSDEGSGGGWQLLALGIIK